MSAPADPVELVGGHLDGNVVQWSNAWTTCEWFSGPKMAANQERAPWDRSNERTIEVCRAIHIGRGLLRILAEQGADLIPYQRSPSGLLAMHRDVAPDFSGE